MIVGDVTTRRAIVDVRDMVRGLWLAAEHGTPGEAYNVGGSAIYSGSDLINVIRSHIKVPLSVECEPSLLRSSDERVIAGDTKKFTSCSGWTPEIHLTQTVHDMVAWWRNRLAPQVASASSQNCSQSQ